LISAAPVITSVTPNTSPAAGGIHVTIKGDGFATCIICSPPIHPEVFFGSTLSNSVDGDMQTLDVVAPPHLPGTVDITVHQGDDATATGAFTFTGNASDAFETILLPIYSPPVHGAFGSEFVTDFQAFNLSRDQALFVYGLTSSLSCSPLLTVPPGLDARAMPLVIAPRNNLRPCSDRSGNPGRLLWLPAGTADFFAANLRVADVSRSLKSAGVEIPIVRTRDFRTGTIALLGLPLSTVGTGFRQQLRIYSLEPEPLTVNVTYLLMTVPVQLSRGADVFDPAYASLSEFFSSPIIDPPPTKMDILIESTDPARHIWAFATVTNNETQEITIVSPN
ncbi:MAG TPA: IPT/TIG domain-containing protein, partial [Thermoanaerobaculia bacterium]